MDVTEIKPPIAQELITVISNALPDDKYQELKEKLGALKAIRTHGKFLWYPFNQMAPQNIIEQVVQYFAGLVDPEGVFAGAEYWTRVRPVAEVKPLHFDKDEYLFRTKEQLKHPAFGSVFYFGPEGGGTLVLKQVADPETRKHIPAEPTHGASIAPKDNQYLLFPGNLRHGVLSEENTVAEEEARLTLLINWWKEAPCEENFSTSWEAIPEDNFFKQAIAIPADAAHIPAKHQPQLTTLDFHQLDL